MSDSIRLIRNKSMLKLRKNTKGSMKKTIGLLVTLLLLNGCAESVALLGSSASSGRIIQSSFNSAISYGIKKQTGKTPLQHAIAYAEEKNPEKKKEPCLSFLEKTNSEICSIVKKQLNLTQSKIKTISRNKLIKDHTSLIQPKIDNKFKIKYLD